MICLFVSHNNAFSGHILKATTPEPKKGSIQTPFPSQKIFCPIKGINLVFIPWHLTGGTVTLWMVFGNSICNDTKKISYLTNVFQYFSNSSFCWKGPSPLAKL